MEHGFVKIHRKIADSWIWQDANKFKWWIDLIMMANHKDNKFLLGNDVFDIKRGEFHTSELKLAERWGVNRKTVRRFLELLESEQMVELKKTRKGTTVKINNYNTYQDKSYTAKDNTRDNTRDNRLDNTVDNAVDNTGDSAVDTNKNVKNDKNVKNEKKKDSCARNPFIFFEEEMLGG